MSLHEALELNNEGVALFNAGEPSRAIEKLQSSLLQARSLIQIPSSEGIDPGTDAICLLSGSQYVQINSIKDRNEYFICLRALAFKEPDSGERSLQALPVYCAAILFNLAILHHKHWMENGSSTLVSKAEAFYEAVLQIIQVSQVQNSTCLFLTLGALNNLAQIDLEKGLVTRFNQRLQYMSVLFQDMSMVLVSALSKQEIGGFLSNILSAGNLNTAPTA